MFKLNIPNVKIEIEKVECDSDSSLLSLRWWLVARAHSGGAGVGARGSEKR